ncbi:MAG: hypothetical protein ACTSPW_16515 [Promethearchaeota archaeon]
MPTIAHSLLGGGIALILYILTNTNGFYSERRFTERMVILVAFNSFIGPDIFTLFYAFHIDTSKIPLKILVHSLLGWPIWCLGILWIWYYVINIRSTPLTKVSKKSVLLLLIAAGEIHFFLDFLDSSVCLIGYGDLAIYISLNKDFLTGLTYMYGPFHDVAPWFSMTEMFFVGVLFLFLLVYSIFRWELKYTILIAILFLITIFSLYFIFGSIVFGFENDFGITLYFGGLLIFPIMLMIFAMEKRDVVCSIKEFN